MANIKSQKKRNRQNEKRRLKNVKVRSAVRTHAKKVIKSIEAKDKDLAKINEEFRKFIKVIDTAVQKGVMHRNTVARKKSRLAKRINALAAAETV